MTSPIRMAISATLHCLFGCSIGEILGMVIGTVTGMHDAAMILLSISLAFLFGYALTIVSLRRSGFDFRKSLRVGIASDTLSITTMEIVDNLIIIAIPGALSAGLTSGLFWGSLLFSLAIAFVVTIPVNYWLISRGMGHALVHSQHGHTSTAHASTATDHDHHTHNDHVRH